MRFEYQIDHFSFQHGMISLQRCLDNFEIRFFNKIAGVPKRVENFLKKGFGDTRHLSIGLRGFGMFEIRNFLKVTNPCNHFEFH